MSTIASYRPIFTSHWIKAFSFVVLLVSSSPYAAPAKFGLAPDNNQELLLTSIQSAKKKLLINIYEIDSDPIVSAILERIRKGVQVEMLVEGKPVGNISKSSYRSLLAIQEAIEKEGHPDSQLYVMSTSTGKTKRRFRFNHAKYCVIDDKKVTIESENFTMTGHPNRNTVGNRGWSILIEDQHLASELTAIFREDSDLSHGDVFAKVPALNTANHPSRGLLMASTRQLNADYVLAEVTEGEATNPRLVTSPDAVAGLRDVIRSATRSIRIEMMSLPLNWRFPSERMNPIVDGLITAAKKGVSVEVLLNDERVFKGDLDADLQMKGNVLTAAYLEKLGRCPGVNLSAKVVDVTDVGITYIHNKGMVIDENAVFVSSINGTQNSVENNREVAVWIESGDAARYYGTAFDFDWNYSPDLDDAVLGQVSVSCATFKRKAYNLMNFDTMNPVLSDVLDLIGIPSKL